LDPLSTVTRTFAPGVWANAAEDGYAVPITTMALAQIDADRALIPPPFVSTGTEKPGATKCQACPDLLIAP